MEQRHMNRKRRMWVDGDGWGWEPQEGAWANLIQDTPSRKAIAAGEVSGWGQMTTVSEIEISGKLEGTVLIRGGMVWQVSDSGQPLCPDCTTPLHTCQDGAVLRCHYGHEYPNPVA
jgi:hypothetical protein